MEILIIVLITLLNGLLAMTETAFVSARKARLQQMADEGNENARITLELTDDPNRFLSTTQIGISLIGILAGAFGGATIAESLASQIALVPALEPYAGTIGLVVVVLFTTYLSLVVGELVPKRLALRDPEGVATAIVPRLRFFARLTSPIIKVLSLSTELLLRLLGVKASDEPPVTAAEIEVLMQQGVDAGVFEETEQEMIEGVFGLADRRITAIMTPRTEIEWIDLDDALDDNLRKIAASSHSRFPVGRGSLDNVQGIVRAKDMLNMTLTGKGLDLTPCVRETLFIPESATAAHALDLFKQSGKHMALVLDEHGGIEGLLTIYSLMDEIVGGLEAPEATQRADGSWLLDGLLPIDDLKDVVEVKELPGEEEGHYETLGGFIMAHLGRIPRAADRFTHDGLSFEVMDMDGMRVDKVLVTRVPVETETANAEES